MDVVSRIWTALNIASQCSVSNLTWDSVDSKFSDYFELSG